MKELQRKPKDGAPKADADALAGAAEDANGVRVLVKAIPAHRSERAATSPNGSAKLGDAVVMLGSADRRPRAPGGERCDLPLAPENWPGRLRQKAAKGGDCAPPTFWNIVYHMADTSPQRVRIPGPPNGRSRSASRGHGVVRRDRHLRQPAGRHRLGRGRAEVRLLPVLSWRRDHRTSIVNLPRVVRGATAPAVCRLGAARLVLPCWSRRRSMSSRCPGPAFTSASLAADRRVHDVARPLQHRAGWPRCRSA